MYHLIYRLSLNLNHHLSIIYSMPFILCLSIIYSNRSSVYHLSIISLPVIYHLSSLSVRPSVPPSSEAAVLSWERACSPTKGTCADTWSHFCLSPLERQDLLTPGGWCPRGLLTALQGAGRPSSRSWPPTGTAPRPRDPGLVCGGLTSPHRPCLTHSEGCADPTPG